MAEEENLNKIVINKLLQRAYVLAHQKNYSQAHNLLKIASEYDASCSDIYYYSALIREMQLNVITNIEKKYNDLTIICSMLKRAIQLDKYNCNYHVKLIKMMNFQYDLAKLISNKDVNRELEILKKQYQESMNQFPKNIDIRLFYGLFNIDQKDYINAKKIFESIINLEPYNNVAIFYIHKIKTHRSINYNG